MKLLYPDQPMQRNRSALEELDDGGYYAEQKLNGYRIELLVNENGGIQPMSRHNKTLAVSPKIIEEIRKLGLPSNTQLDGEWMKLREATQAIKMPEMIYFFDVLTYGGEDLRDVPCWQRRQKLLKLLGLPLVPESKAPKVVEYEWGDQRIRVPDLCLSGFRDFFEKQKKNPWVEGVVIKRKTYLSKASSVKSHDSGELVKIRYLSGDDGMRMLE